jgi:hypothetical protein
MPAHLAAAGVFQRPHFMAEFTFPLAPGLAVGEGLDPFVITIAGLADELLRGRRRTGGGFLLRRFRLGMMLAAMK